MYTYHTNPKMESSKEETQCSATSQNNDAENFSNSNTFLHYDILRYCFKYLNFQDLSSARMVCKVWTEAAIHEYFSRGPCYFMARYIKDWYKDDGGRLHKFEITDLSINPILGFNFVHDTNMLKRKYYKHLLYCSTFLVFSTNGIIRDKNEMEDCIDHTALFTFLPRVLNTDIRMIEISKKVKLKKCLDKKFIQLPTLSHDISTCCIVFCNFFSCNKLNYMFRLLKKWYSNQISSMWGGMSEHKVRYVKNSVWHKARGVIIFISGAIKTWSIIIDSKCNTEELIKKKLKLFKERIKLRRHCMGFMFTSVLRGTMLHTKKNIESTIFKNVFPKVPLVGCFGISVFGKNTIDDVEKKSQNQTKIKKKYDWLINNSIDNSKRDHPLFNKSTSFMILSYD